MPIADLVARFDAPAAEFTPCPIWWWSGERLEIDRLRWQLDQLIAGGIRQAVILNLASAGPLYGKDADDPPFMSEPWWEIFLAVCAHAKERGFRLWFYDQIGFSGANVQGRLIAGHPEFSARLLRRIDAEVASGGRLDAPNSGTALAAFLTRTGTTQPEPVALAGHGAIAPAAGRLQLVYSVVGGFAYDEPAACAALLDAIHGEFARRAGAYLGSVIVGSFQDELPSMPLWGERFAAAYRARWGEDLLPEIWRLFEGEDARSQDVRIRAHRLRAELVETSLFKPFFAWHESHGLTCGFDQQHPARAGDAAQGVSKYADYLSTHRWYGAPGSDHHGDASVHRSLADVLGRPRVWIEAFHSSGWGGTLEETFDWLMPWLRAGANLYNPHAVYYSTRGGWWEWAAPSTCWRQPYWREHPLFAAAVARCQALLTTGEHRCEIGVAYPSLAAQGFVGWDGPMPPADQSAEEFRLVTGVMNWGWPEAGACDRAGLDFHVLAEFMWDDARIVDGRLVSGPHRLHTVVLPGCRLLSAAAARALAALVAAGGTVLVLGTAPERIVDGPQDDLERLRRHWRITDQAGLVAELRRSPVAIRCEFPVHHRQSGDTHAVLVTAALRNGTIMPTGLGGHRRVWNDYSYGFDPAVYCRSIELTVEQPGLRPWLWCPVSGGRRPAAVRHDAGRTTITVDFSSGPMLWVVWDETAPAPAAASVRALRDVAALDDGWRGRAMQTIDNRHGDLALPAGEPIRAQTWDFEHIQGSGTPDPLSPQWAIARPATATFGPYTWLLEKADPDWAPAERWPHGIPVETQHRWRTRQWSLSRGILRDEVQVPTLGVSGHVPEDFIAIGEMRTGQTVELLWWLHREAASDRRLVVTGTGVKRIRIAGVVQEAVDDGFRNAWNVHIPAGTVPVQIRLTAVEDGPVRLSWCLLTAEPARPWPCWIAAPAPNQRDRTVHFTRRVTLAQPADAVFNIQAVGQLVLRVDGTEIGRQGGFTPYTDANVFSVVHHRLAGLSPGPHTIEVVMTEGSAPARFILDARLGTQCLISDAAWMVEVAGDVTRPRLWHAVHSPWYGMHHDPGYEVLERRPHPLPRSAWLEGDHGGVVEDAVPDLWPGERHDELWFRWRLPPGVRQVRLPAAGTVRLWLDGRPAEVSAGVAQVDGAPQWAVAAIRPQRGRFDGAAWDGPITYELGEGAISLGDWTRLGLANHSGTVTYVRDVELAEAQAHAVLDLGRVRGTARVSVNGVEVGARFCGPWHFTVGPQLRPGRNRIEVVVANTLAPYLRGHSPTNYAQVCQLQSGLFGPVRLQA
ncbi:MAG: hypothetical protein J0M02_00670 [Planctomycetes bacterium]|nr:hypothetical protein [Planctomycetota bacterium]